MNDIDPNLLDLIDLGSARGGKKSGAFLSIEPGRSLTPDDLPALQSPPPLGTAAPSAQQLRYSHHRIAQLLAKGEKLVDVCLITGYSVTYISNMRNHDPAFQELIKQYEGERRQIFVDVLERMKDCCISSLEELQERLALEPEKWTKRELMEFAELTGIKPMMASRQASALGSSSGGPSVSVNVKFVAAGKTSSSSPIIDLEHEEIS